MPKESRRTFLRRVSQAGLLAATGGFLPRGRSASAEDPASTLPILESRPDTGPIGASLKSTVVHIRRPEVVDRQSIHAVLLREMIEDSVKALTETRKAADAWNKLLMPDDMVGIKFNHVGAEELDSTDMVAAQLVQSLEEAGFSPQRIMLIEVPTNLASKLGTRPGTIGWSGGEVSFGTGAEELAAVLKEVTAIINVPFLKTHNIAGVTGCLKNLSHALIRRPGRYHDQACAPYVANIVALPQIRSKIRLNVVNAVRALFEGGPNVEPQGMWNHAGLIVSRDPVAADAVGTDIINDERRRRRLAPVGNKAGQIPHIHAAARLGLGTDDQDYINLVDLKE